MPQAPKCKICGSQHWFSEPHKFESAPAERSPSKPRNENVKPASATKSKGGRPRIGEADKTIAAIKPWEKLGMSRSTWYRRQAEKG